MFCLPQRNAKNKKTTDGFITEGGLGSLGSISSLLRVLPTHRRTCAATTGVDAEFSHLVHFDISNHNAAGEKVNLEGSIGPIWRDAPRTLGFGGRDFSRDKSRRLIRGFNP
jgi:hypothetical protein